MGFRLFAVAFVGSAVGLWLVSQLQAGARIAFTFLWQEGWEEKDFQVEIATSIKRKKRYDKSKLATDLTSHKSIR